jgi:hypothetical protein
VVVIVVAVAAAMVKIDLCCNFYAFLVYRYFSTTECTKQDSQESLCDVCDVCLRRTVPGLALEEKRSAKNNPTDSERNRNVAMYA